jgi:hypothetical protein
MMLDGWGKYKPWMKGKEGTAEGETGRGGDKETDARRLVSHPDAGV